MEQPNPRYTTTPIDAYAPQQRVETVAPIEAAIAAAAPSIKNLTVSKQTFMEIRYRLQQEHGLDFKGDTIELGEYSLICEGF